MAIRIVDVAKLPVLLDPVLRDDTMVLRGVTPSPVEDKRKGDRHKAGQAAYMRAYRASKKPK